MTISTNRDSDRFMLRLPDGMRDQIREEAERNGRSMNAEIVERLERSFVESVTEEGLSIIVETYERLIRENVALNRVIHRLASGTGHDVHAMLQEEDEKFQTRSKFSEKPSGGGGGGNTWGISRTERHTRLNAPIKPFGGKLP